MKPMQPTTVEEIERAIEALAPRQLEELYAWLDREHPQEIDAHLVADLKSGRLDERIQRALADQKTGRTSPL